MSNIAAAINDAHANVEKAKLQGTKYAIECGRLLTEAKSTLKHGEWDGWVKAHCHFSARTAQLYMKVAKHVGDDKEKAQRVADLSLRDVAAELARPRVSIAAKAEAYDLLAKFYGADGASKIRFAMHLLDRGEIDPKAYRAMVKAAGLKPELAAQQAALVLFKHIPVDRHAYLVSQLSLTGVPDLLDACTALMSSNDLNAQTRVF